MLIGEIYSITERNFNFPYMFNYDLFENRKTNNLYFRIIKFNSLCYSLTLLINSFVFIDTNVRSNIKKAIQNGTIVYSVFFEMFIKPNINALSTIHSHDVNLDNKIIMTNEVKYLLEKHSKMLRILKINNESLYFYCKNNNEQLIKLNDNYFNLIRNLLR